MSVKCSSYYMWGGLRCSCLLGKSFASLILLFFFTYLVLTPSRRWVKEARRRLGLSNDLAAVYFLRRHQHRAMPMWRKLLDDALLELEHWFGSDHFISAGGNLTLLELAKFDKCRAFNIFLDATGRVRRGVSLGDVPPHVVGETLIGCNFRAPDALAVLRKDVVLDLALKFTLTRVEAAAALARNDWDVDATITTISRGRRDRSEPKHDDRSALHCRLCGWRFSSDQRGGAKAACGEYFCSDESCTAHFPFCVGCSGRIRRKAVVARRCRCPSCGRRLQWLDRLL
jgi:hypothetical protein